MAYLGRGLDKISNIEVLDNITFDGSSSYSITKGSVAFTPNSAQSLLISIDGVVQATNFTVNSSTIDFGVAIPSTSTCNFFLHYGTGLITVPSDGSVTTAKLGSNAVSSAKMFSGFANGITEADMWRLTANLSSNADPISSNLERVDNTGFGYIGTGMSVSSGVWTFPSTGIYCVINVMAAQGDSGDNIAINMQTTTDNSTYTSQAEAVASTSTGETNQATQFVFFDVTNTSTHKMKFQAASISGSSLIRGDTNETKTAFIFIRLGDT